MLGNDRAQYYEEDRKGTLTPDKLADLVILDQNPLTIEPSKIRTIRVVKTIKEGRPVWSAPAFKEPQPGRIADCLQAQGSPWQSLFQV